MCFLLVVRWGIAPTISHILDINGKSIEFIKQNSFHFNGDFISVWDSGINSSGTYFVKITDGINNQNIVQKLMLIK